MKKFQICAILLSTLISCKKQKPNVIIVLADDLGIGDVSAYNKDRTLHTPGIDALADDGIRFTNGYCTAATSTPSRYSLLTGEYPHRNKGAQILNGDAGMLIQPEQKTIADAFKKSGYATAVIGKWHLGLGNGSNQWNGAISPSPNDIGFDYSLVIAATNDRVPSVYVENKKVRNLDPNDPLEVDYRKNISGEPSGKDPEVRKNLKMDWSGGHNNSVWNGIPRIGYQKGGVKARFIDENMADDFSQETQHFIKKQKDANKPFFLYYALHEPHVPRIVHNRFAGKSGLGPRGDAVLEADWCIQELVRFLKKEGLYDNTIIVFSSDNGPILDDGYKDDAWEKLGNHKPWGNNRGNKYGLYDAGTRVPFIVSWPAEIQANKVSDALVSQVDLFTSLSTLIGEPTATQDGQNILDALLGKTEKARDYVFSNALGKRFSYRKGDYLYIPPLNGPTKLWSTLNLPTGIQRPAITQLYNLVKDPKQQNNIATLYPKIVKQMQQEYADILGVDSEKYFKNLTKTKQKKQLKNKKR